MTKPLTIDLHTLAAAAGVSPAALRARIKRGELHPLPLPTGRGHPYQFSPIEAGRWLRQLDIRTTNPTQEK